MSVVIQVENLSKYYRLGLIGGGTLREDLNRWWAKARGRPDPLLKIGETDHAHRVGGERCNLASALHRVCQRVVAGGVGGSQRRGVRDDPIERLDATWLIAHSQGFGFAIGVSYLSTDCAEPVLNRPANPGPEPPAAR